MRVAVVQDWLVVNGGAEKVLKEIINHFEEVDVFSLIDFLSEKDRMEILGGRKTKTSFIQNLPNAKNNYRYYLALFPIAIERFDFTGYDLIISSSYAVAKGIKKVNKDQIHICYCHSPIRYAWDLEEEYLEGFVGFKRRLAKIILAYIRRWDLKTVDRVDLFLANSHNVSERISRIYKKNSIVLYPPVSTEKFIPYENKENYYFTSARLVKYKRIDLMIEAFNELPDLELIIAGDGPELNALKKLANKNITFVGYLNQNELIKFIQKAKWFILAANEDFGITSIESQSCLTPVIALEKGGYLETVVNNKTGVFFTEQNCKSLKNVISSNQYTVFNKTDFEVNVSKFSVDKFHTDLKVIIDRYVKNR